MNPYISFISALIFVFVVLPASFLFIFVYIPKTIRRKKMESLAREFDLSFQSNIDHWKWFSISSPSDSRYNDRNIISGSINSHQIEVYDSFSREKIPVMGIVGSIANPWQKGLYEYTRRRTILKSDNLNEELKSNLGWLWFPSIRKIRKSLIALK